ncbi:MAG: right-handed parallel beta-helix repeat-containing protein [Cyanobacteria bacterium P01_C01_bin.72]
MFVKQGNINLNSRITDDWGNVQRIVLDIEALSQTQGWKIEIPQDNYTIDQIYGAKITEENGKTYISGASWNQDLEQEEKTEVVLIVDEINPVDHSSYVFNAVEPVAPPSAPNLNSRIVETWYGGYKLEVDLKAESDIQNWQSDFSLPYHIRAVYGVELTDRGNGNYTISGESGKEHLRQGESFTSVFIIDDYGQSAIAPEFESNNSQPAATPVISNSIPEPIAEPEVNQDVVENEVSHSTPEPMVENEVSHSTPEPMVENEVSHPTPEPMVENEVSHPTPEPVIEPSPNHDLTANPDGGGRIINVDQDFGGNLESAVAAANDGDVIQLGGRTYYTSGITIDKDITFDGQAGTIIDGQGTLQPIIRLNPGASGATVQDLKLTNANQGIYAYKAFDLTLQNLEIDNIGLNQTIRDGQDNTGIVLNQVDGVQLLNSSIRNVGRKGVGINDTDGAFVSGLTVQNVNLAAQHAQSFDAAGIKFFNTNDVVVQDSYFADINAFSIWNDTTIATTISGNVIENVGEDFLRPVFNTNVEIAGIYNEKSANAVIKNNQSTAVSGFVGLNATEFSTETMILENNNFSSIEFNTQDYWVNESAETLIAITENPLEADFSLINDAFFAQANIG